MDFNGQILYKRFKLYEYLGEEVEIHTLIITRLTKHIKNMVNDRRVIVVPIKAYVPNNSTLDKDNVLYNPIPILYAVDFDGKQFPISGTRELNNIDVSIVDHWAFKKYSWITPLPKIPYHMPWSVSLDIHRMINNLKYEKERFHHLEYYSICTYPLIGFKLALEYLRNKNYDPKLVIENFDSLLDSGAMYKYIYNHTLDTLPYNQIPDNLKGVFKYRANEDILDFRD